MNEYVNAYGLIIFWIGIGLILAYNVLKDIG